VESWLKESEEDANKAEEYLDKKREKKAIVSRGSTSDLRGGSKSNVVFAYFSFCIITINFLINA
jgi:hypothetical protein